MRALPDFVTQEDGSLYYSGSALTLDFETTNKQYGSPLEPANELLLAVWHSSIDGSVTVRWGSEFHMADLLEAIEKHDFIVAHNAKFELGWLRRCGFDLTTKPVYDTMLAEWVIAGNRPWRKNLNACLARRKLGGKESLVDTMIKMGIDCRDIPRGWLERYCVIDVKMTERLFREQLKEMEPTRLPNVAWNRCLVTPALCDIEFQGMMLDGDLVRAEYKRLVQEQSRVLAELEDMTGGINPRSGPQVAEFVYGKLGFEELKDRQGKPVRNKPSKAFPDGAPKVDKTTMSKLKASTPEQRRFLELRDTQAKLSAAIDKNLAMFVGAVEEKGGMLYATLNQGRTGTHRLSSSGIRTYYEMFDAEKGCQFQNLPNQFKGMFQSRSPDNLFIEVDYSQLEYRIAGQLAGESIIFEEVAEGYDVHRYTASVLNNCTEEEVDYAMRRNAKADTFKPLFGGESGTKAQKRYYQAFRDKYPALATAQADWRFEVETTKALNTASGLCYYWPEAKVEQSWGGARLNVHTQVCNYPIQGFATGEIVPIGLAYLWHRVKAEQMETILVNTVHDSVEAEAPPSEVEFFTELATCALINDVVEHLDRTYNYTMVVQMGLGFTVGSHWGNNTYDYTAFAERASDQTVQYAWDGDELSVEVTL